MLSTFLAVIAGFFGWVLLWVACEKMVCALWPKRFGVHQRAFEEALTKGGPFTANTGLLLMHLVLAPIVSAASGYLAARISGETTVAPAVLSVLLLALGVLKSVLSWSYCPLWYHIAFTAILIPLCILGSRLYGIT